MMLGLGSAAAVAEREAMVPVCLPVSKEVVTHND
jgi:hypothetical protein